MAVGMKMLKSELIYLQFHHDISFLFSNDTRDWRQIENSNWLRSLESLRRRAGDGDTPVGGGGDDDDDNDDEDRNDHDDDTR